MTAEFKFDDVQNRTLSPQTREALAAQLKADVNAFCVREFTGEHRNHLGASVIGMDCSAAIWFAYRWVKFEIFDGRMLRLFNRGHLEEARFIQWLRGIGCTVWEVDPATGQQFRIWGVQGHYGGSSDSVGVLPYLPPNFPLLMEFKTHNKKSFDKLVKHKVVISKPQHYAQMCSYGKHYSFRYGLYCAVNKDDDDLYFEVVELDWRLANELTNKAQDIITSKTRPARISDNPTYFKCKMCSFAGICHGAEQVEKNCRSCKFAEPAEQATWYCTRHHATIPAHFIAKGCPDHVSIMAI